MSKFENSFVSKNLVRRMIFQMLLAFFLLNVPHVFAQQSQTVTSAHTEVQLLSEVSSLHITQEVFTVALRMKPDAGWHIYWKNPGDSGLPVSINWQLPEGYAAGEIQWPVPKRIYEEPLMTYGYEGETVLLIDMKAVPSSVMLRSGVTFQAQVKWLACEAVCIPGKADLSLVLPIADNPSSISSVWQQTFHKAREALPKHDSDWQVTAQPNWSLTVRTDSDTANTIQSAYFFFQEPQSLSYSAQQVFTPSVQGFDLQLVPADSTAVLKNLNGVLKVFYADGSSEGIMTSGEVDLTAGQYQVITGSAAKVSSTGIIWMLFFAFIGGLILNLMPCVFPVLSIKILSVVQHYQEDSTKLLRHGVLFSIGVVTTFLALAAALIVLRAGGEQIGWGFQLQSPKVVFALAVLFWLLALNLFGVFEMGTSLAGLQWSGSKTSENVQAFMSGFLATIVATPCTAPFMGTALGFALTQPAWVGLSVFGCLGMGMALPYLLLCVFPDLLRWVPKPGPWMIRMKQFLGVLLIATVLWLCWVLNQQLAYLGVIKLTAVFWMTGLACWIIGYWAIPSKDAPIRTRARIVASVIFIAAFAVGIKQIDSAPMRESSQQETEGVWQPYSDARLQAELAQGRRVFVDFTAAWCLSCQVNERLALDKPKVLEKFESLGVVLLKADWTNQDEEITQALDRLGRNSIPVYALYDPRTPENPKLLPELLTQKIVLEALEPLN